MGIGNGEWKTESLDLPLLWILIQRIQELCLYFTLRLTKLSLLRFVVQAAFE